MPTDEQARLLLEKLTQQRQQAISAAQQYAAGVAGLSILAPTDLAGALHAGMMSTVEAWRADAAALETSTKHGAKGIREGLRKAAEQLAGFAGGLVAAARLMPTDQSSPAATELLATLPVESNETPEPKPAGELMQPELPIPNSVISSPPAIDALAQAIASGAFVPFPDTLASPPIPTTLLAPAFTPKVRMTWAEFASRLDALEPSKQGSFSTINDLADCGLKYALTRMGRQGIVDAPAPAWWEIGGSAFHSAVQVIESTMLASSAGMPNFNAEAAWLSHFEAAIIEAESKSKVVRTLFRAADKGKENYDWWRVHGPQLLANYIEYWAPRRAAGWGILVLPDGRPGLEIELTLNLDGWPFVCVVDQIWRTPMGGVHIDDMKAGKSSPSATLQLGGYAHAVAEAIWGAEYAYAGAHVSGAYYKAREASHDGEVHDLLARHPRAELQMLARSARSMIESKAFLPRVSDWGGGCSSCGHRAICPARVDDDYPAIKPT